MQYLSRQGIITLVDNEGKTYDVPDYCLLAHRYVRSSSPSESLACLTKSVIFRQMITVASQNHRSSIPLEPIAIPLISPNAAIFIRALQCDPIDPEMIDGFKSFKSLIEACEQFKCLAIQSYLFACYPKDWIRPTESWQCFYLAARAGDMAWARHAISIMDLNSTFGRSPFQGLSVVMIGECPGLWLCGLLVAVGLAWKPSSPLTIMTTENWKTVSEVFQLPDVRPYSFALSASDDV